MLYRFTAAKTGLVLLLVTAPLFLFALWQQWPWTRSNLQDWLLPLGLYVLLLGFLHQRFFLLRAVRTDEHGLTVERRLAADLFFPWSTLQVTYQPRAKRAAGGLMLERSDEDEPYFLVLTWFDDEEQLRQEIATRLGGRDPQ